MNFVGTLIRQDPVTFRGVCDKLHFRVYLRTRSIPSGALWSRDWSWRVCSAILWDENQ